MKTWKLHKICARQVSRLVIVIFFMIFKAELSENFRQIPAINENLIPIRWWAGMNKTEGFDALKWEFKFWRQLSSQSIISHTRGLALETLFIDTTWLLRWFQFDITTCALSTRLYVLWLRRLLISVLFKFVRDFISFFGPPTERLQTSAQATPKAKKRFRKL